MPRFQHTDTVGRGAIIYACPFAGGVHNRVSNGELPLMRMLTQAPTAPQAAAGI